MPRKEYRPKTTRKKLPLTIEEQRNLLMKASEKEKALLVLMLSTGMHPKVLSDRSYGLTFNDNYYEWNRPKTYKVVRGGWSKAVKEGNIIATIKKMEGCGRQWYWELLKTAGLRIKLKGLCPNQLRHTYFVNLARLQYNPYDIAAKSATNFKTAYEFYMTGMGEGKGLSDTDKDFLKWLMEA